VASVRDVLVAKVLEDYVEVIVQGPGKINPKAAAAVSFQAES
jgi:hypothetical protein